MSTMKKNVQIQDPIYLEVDVARRQHSLLETISQRSSLAEKPLAQRSPRTEKNPSDVKLQA